MASLVLGGSEASGAEAASSPAPARPRPALTRQLTGTMDNMSDMSSDESDDEARMGFRSSSVGVDNSGNGAKGKATSEAGRGEAPAAMPLKSTFGASGAQSSNMDLHVRVAGIKDEGVRGKENQDDFFIWSHGRTHVVVVLDGHGRELGKLASKAAKDSMFKDLTNLSILGSLRVTPKETMTTVFGNANNAIREVSEKESSCTSDAQTQSIKWRSLSPQLSFFPP
eukprot:g1941.t1